MTPMEHKLLKYLQERGDYLRREISEKERELAEINGKLLENENIIRQVSYTDDSAK
jgi:hypothetical protein